ncbi:MAG: hypothetical protein ACPG8W_12510 [Candidatus Promineifilaceae bacterium]
MTSLLNGLVAVALIVWICVPLYARLTRNKQTCPACHSESIELISKEPEGKPIIHGGRVTATVTYSHRYHCKRCGERWQYSKSESW